MNYLRNFHDRWTTIVSMIRSSAGWRKRICCPWDKTTHHRRERDQLFQLQSLPRAKYSQIIRGRQLNWGLVGPVCFCGRWAKYLLYVNLFTYIHFCSRCVRVATSLMVKSLLVWWFLSVTLVKALSSLWIGEQYNASLRMLLDNVYENGTVIASPSRKGPDYYVSLYCSPLWH